MIVHIFPYEKFTKDYIMFVNKNFDDEEHIFFLYGKYDVLKNGSYDSYSNVFDFSLNRKKCIQSLNDSSAIMLHSLYLSKDLILLFNKNTKWLKKTGWVVWGGDLHSMLLLKTHKRLKQKIIHRLRLRIVKKIKAIITLTPKDYDYAKTYLDEKCKNFPAMYGSHEIINLLNVAKEGLSKGEHAPVKIMVGHSAGLRGGHFETFKLLEKFKNEHIQIVSPLSYGSDENRDKIIKLGREIFGDKFIPITDFMAYEEYLKFLYGIDIVVINNKNQQQALGNLRALAYYGCKLYVCFDTSMGQEFNEILDVFSVDEINNMTFKEFIEFSDQSKLKNKNAILDIYDDSKISKEWQEIFNYLSN